MKLFNFFIVGILGISQSNHSSAQSAIVAKDATLQKIAGHFKFTEGPAADSDGNIYFTDQPNDQIVKWDHQDGSLKVFMSPSGRSNGLFVDHQGNIISCADANNELWKIDLLGNKTVLVSDYGGKKLNGPNDLWIDQHGGIYITDPYYQRDWWSHNKPELESRDVYYLAADKTELVKVATNFVQPNGIIGTSKNQYLFIADIGDDKTYRYEILGPGQLGERELFIEKGSDGMTLDQFGNLYITGDGVTVFDKIGKQIEHIPIPENWTANICFGGPHRKTLFITSMGSVYTLKMKVSGQPH